MYRDDRNHEPKTRVSVARRNLKELAAQNSDSTKRNRIQGRLRGVTRQWIRVPNYHPDARQGKSGEARGKDASLLPHAAKNEALSNVWKLWVMRNFKAPRCSVRTRSKHPSMAF